VSWLAGYHSGAVPTGRVRGFRLGPAAGPGDMAGLISASLIIFIKSIPLIGKQVTLFVSISDRLLIWLSQCTIATPLPELSTGPRGQKDVIGPTSTTGTQDRTGAFMPRVSWKRRPGLRYTSDHRLHTSERGDLTLRGSNFPDLVNKGDPDGIRECSGPTGGQGHGAHPQPGHSMMQERDDIEKRNPPCSVVT
jgi:hypothetical protein